MSGIHAVLHTRDQEETVEFIQIISERNHGLLNLLVVVDAGASWNFSIGKTVVVDQLAATPLEGTEVVIVRSGIARVETVGKLNRGQVKVISRPVLSFCMVEVK